MQAETKALITEVWATGVMSLTGLLTAWSAYQANIWTGEQNYALAQSIEVQLDNAEEALLAKQQTTIDAMLALESARALVDGHPFYNEKIVPRLRPGIREPIQNWLALDPLNNPTAPSDPLHMPEYKENVVKEANIKLANGHKRLKKLMKEAQIAGGTSDGYTLLTVLFAVVMFFAGMASTFKNYKLKLTMLAVSTLILLSTTAKLWSLAVHFG